MDFKYRIREQGVKVPDQQNYRYYKSIVNDILQICETADWENIKMLHPNPNQDALNKCILAYSSIQDCRKYVFTILNIVKCIYGEKSRDFYNIMRIYCGMKSQSRFLFHMKKLLKYADMPKHYVKAVLFNTQCAEKRIKTIYSVLETYLKLTPLCEYQKMLPDGKTLAEDISECISSEPGRDGMVFSEESVMEYLKKVSETVSMNSVNESRRMHDVYTQIKVNEGIAEREKKKQEKRQKNLNAADDAAIIYARHIQKQFLETDGRIKTHLYRKAAQSGYKKPKIFVLISAKNAAMKTKFKPMYMDDNGNPTYTISKTIIIENESEIPARLQELYSGYKYGYAELLL